MNSRAPLAPGSKMQCSQKSLRAGGEGGGTVPCPTPDSDSIGLGRAQEIYCYQASGGRGVGSQLGSPGSGLESLGA